MKKLFVLLCTYLLLMGASLFPAQRGYAFESLSRTELVNIKQTVMSLWALGFHDIEAGQGLSQQDVLRSSLYYLISTEDGDRCEFHWSHPERFASVSDAYKGFFSKDIVEETALRLFGQKLNNPAPFFGIEISSEGYYVDFWALQGDREQSVMPNNEAVLPGYAEIFDVQHNNGIWILQGKLRRFNEVNGVEILWQAAPFTLRLSRGNSGLILKSLSITEEGMG